MDGHHIRSARTANLFTLEQLAAAAGITKAYLARIETRQSSPGIDVMIRLADALDLPLDELVGRGTPKTNAALERARSVLEAVSDALPAVQGGPLSLIRPRYLRGRD